MAPDPLGITGLADIRELARGPRGVLYRARQPALDRDVVVRVLDEPPGPAPPPHPHLASVYGSGRTARGEPYVLLPYLPGGSLDDRCAAGPLPAAEAAELGAKLAGGLDALHRAGAVHGRVAARNVLWSAYGQPQLTDCCAQPGGQASPADDVHALARVVLDAVGQRPDRRLAAALAAPLAADPAVRPPAAELERRLRELAPAGPPGERAKGRGRRLAGAGAVVAVLAGAAASRLVVSDSPSAAEVDAAVDTRAKRCTPAGSAASAGGVTITAPAPDATVPRAVSVSGTADPAAGPVRLFVHPPGICLYYFHRDWAAPVGPDGRWSAVVDTGVARGESAQVWAVQLDGGGRALLDAVADRFERRIDDDPYVGVLPDGARGAYVAVTVG